jgi:hypothetical protein
MSGIELPTLLEQAIQEGITYGQVIPFIETNEPMPGFNEQPIDFQSTQLGTYSVIPINMPQNYTGPNNELLKAFVILAKITYIPSGIAANTYTNQLPLPQPYINTYGTLATFTGQLTFQVYGTYFQIEIPSSVPQVDACLVMGF